MGVAVREVNRDVSAPLTLDQWAALGDFIYNVGAGNFRASTLLKKLNARDYAGAAAELDKWDHAGGRVLAGLLKRRQAETALFTKA
jgi:GH24 family phage-related lysozyme (muramidase)